MKPGEFKTAKLALSDGTVFTGAAFGAEGEVFGEVVFNTSLTGYQEILTDPSYCGQIVTMTYPHIGNYGVNTEDVESSQLALKGFVVKELCRFPSNYRSEQSLDEYLRDANVIGLEGIDTRALVRRIRIHGAMTGVLSTQDLNDESLIEKAKHSPELSGRDLVQEVIPNSAYDWEEELSPLSLMPVESQSESEQEGTSSKIDNSAQPNVVLIDYGMKWNIPRHLKHLGCKVEVIPGTASASEILDRNPDGVFLSNGPGDPRPLTHAIDTIQKLIGKVPLFGICLGQQLLGLACGGEIFKLKFGHRGANQPVMNHRTGRVEITTQNHGFALDADSLPDTLEVTHTNLNDGTVEGIRHKRFPVAGVQYHPEASAGPHDSQYLFNEFFRMLDCKTPAS